MDEAIRRSTGATLGAGSGTVPASTVPRSTVLPSTVLPDARGGGRAMRVTWHREADCVVLSSWVDDRCVSSFRVAAAHIPLLVQALVEGLATYAPAARTPTSL